MVVSFESELPSAQTMQELRLLAVVAWRYDGSLNNGMPPPELRQSMIALEDLIEKHNWARPIYRAYGRTGNNLKELVYYTNSQEAFHEGINAALCKAPRYPIDITFYADEEWDDLRQLQTDFVRKA